MFHRNSISAPHHFCNAAKWMRTLKVFIESSFIALDIIENSLRHMRNIYISKGTIKMSTYPHAVLVW